MWRKLRGSSVVCSLLCIYDGQCVRLCSQRQMWLPVGLVGDGQAGQPGAVIIHDVVRPICWTHDLHGDHDEVNQSADSTETNSAELQQS